MLPNVPKEDYGPCVTMQAETPSDTLALSPPTGFQTSGPPICRGLLITVTGNIAFIDGLGKTVALSSVPAWTEIHCQVRQIKATGTTATGIFSRGGGDMTLTEKIFLLFFACVAVGTCCFLGWDVYLAANGEPTISASIRAMAKSHWEIQACYWLIVAGLGWHFFWQ